MPVVKRLTNRQKKHQEKSRESLIPNDGKSGKKPKSSDGKNPCVKLNQTANGLVPKGGVAVASERSLTRSQTPSNEMPGYSNQLNKHRNYRNKPIRKRKNQIKGPVQYYGRKSFNHSTSVVHYKKIKAAFKKSKLWALKRLQTKKKKQEKRAVKRKASSAAMAAKAPAMSTSGPAVASAILTAEEEWRQLDLGPMSFQRYIHGCVDWMMRPPENASINKAISARQPPKLNPIGYEMLAKEQMSPRTHIANPQQEWDDAVLQIAMQMDAMKLSVMSPHEFNLALMAEGLDFTKFPRRQPEPANWMCKAILKILNEPNEPSPNNDFIDSWRFQDSSPPLSGSEIRAQIDRAVAQVPERSLSPIAAASLVVQPTYDVVQMPPTYDDDEPLQMPEENQQAQTPKQKDKNQPKPPKDGNRRSSNNFFRRRNSYRAGRGRFWQTQRCLNWENYQCEDRNHNPHLEQSQVPEENYNSNLMEASPPVESFQGMIPAHNYAPYPNMPPYQSIPPYMLYPGAQAEHHQPVAADPVANFGAPPPPINASNNNNSFVGPPHPFNQTIKNHYAPMMMPQRIFPNQHQRMEVSHRIREINERQMQLQQQKFQKSRYRFSTLRAANSPRFFPFSRKRNVPPWKASDYNPTFPFPFGPGQENDFKLSDANFPPLPVPLKIRQLKERMIE